MFSRFDIEDQNIFKTCIVATMSCGKSTFINSIIGDEILPEKNEACTARTMAVIDNDGAVEKKAHIIYQDGTADIKYISNRQALEEINNDENVADFLVETDIASIKNSSKALVLIDTPGVNNSGDERHGQRTEELLRQVKDGLIIYLLNATQLATNDDALLLEIISGHIKKNPQVHIFFVVNKIDALDLEKESIPGTLKKMKDYIEDHGIKRPVIYPLSALSAKLLRMTYYRKEMTRREKRRLEEVYEDYKPKENNMLSYALIGDASDETYEIGDDEISGQDLQRAIENTGIVAIEKKIEEIMLESIEHYTPEIIIKSMTDDRLLQENHDRIQKLSLAVELDNYGNFNNLKNKANYSAALRQINKGVRNETVLCKNVEKEAETGDVFQLLLNDIETLKSRFRQVFNEYFFVGLPSSENKYIIPAEKGDSYIQARELYFTSEDKANWNTANFNFLLRNTKDGKEIYIYNSITQFLSVISDNNVSTIIALLDVKLPFTVIELGRMEKSVVCSIEDAAEYIDEEEALYTRRINEIREREQRAGRTYKGIEFPTEEEKDRVISLEKEIREFCLNAAEQKHQVLWDKKEELVTLPYAIFSPYITQLVSAMDRVENEETLEYIHRISTADLEAIYHIESEIQGQNYTRDSLDKLRIALDEGVQRCQTDVLEHMIENMCEMSREELHELLNQIKEKDFPQEMVSSYSRKVEKQYDVREQQELADLCKGLEEKSIEELSELSQVFLSGGYQEKFYGSYESQIDKRIDYLYIAELDEICSRLEDVDRDGIQCIKEKVETLPCKEFLKKDFLVKIEKQSEILDLKALKELTADLENKSLDEYQEIMDELQNGNYNKKYIHEYLMKTRIYMEKAEKQQLDTMTASLNSKNKAETERLEENILRMHYPDRVNSSALKKIYKRKFILDVLQLLQLSNDFDQLSETDIRRIRMECEQKDVLEECREFYYKKLDEREFNIAFQKIVPYAAKMRQIIDSQYAQFPGVYIAEQTEEYLTETEIFRMICDEKDRYELPVFVLSSDVYIAMTLTGIYTKVNNSYTRFDLQEIQSIISIKKFLFEGLALNLKNGDSVGISGTVSKKMIPAMMGILNDMIGTIVNHDTFMPYAPIDLHVESYSLNDITNAVEDYEECEESTILRFIEKYLKCQEQLGYSGSFHYIGEAKWQNNEQKAIANMGILNEDSIILYFDNTIFGSAKEGFAVGRKFIHIKKSGQSLISIPIAEIARIRKRESTEKIEIILKDYTITIMDNIISREAETLAALLEEYVFDMQLLTAYNTF